MAASYRMGVIWLVSCVQTAFSAAETMSLDNNEVPTDGGPVNRIYRLRAQMNPPIIIPPQPNAAQSASALFQFIAACQYSDDGGQSWGYIASLRRDVEAEATNPDTTIPGPLTGSGSGGGEEFSFPIVVGVQTVTRLNGGAVVFTATCSCVLVGTTNDSNIFLNAGNYVIGANDPYPEPLTIASDAQVIADVGGGCDATFGVFSF